MILRLGNLNKSLAIELCVSGMVCIITVDKYENGENDDCEEVIKGQTFLDNFDMSKFFDYIGIPEDAVEWGS